MGVEDSAERVATGPDFFQKKTFGFSETKECQAKTP
jgi:hypothetical protein